MQSRVSVTQRCHPLHGIYVAGVIDEFNEVAQRQGRLYMPEGAGYAAGDFTLWHIVATLADALKDTGLVKGNVIEMNKHQHNVVARCFGLGNKVDF